MFSNALNQIELTAACLSSNGLLGAGIAFTFAGLVIWLAGLGLTRIATAAVGGFAGVVTASIFFNMSGNILGIGAIIGVVAGIVFELLTSTIFGFARMGYNLCIVVTTAVAGTAMIFIGMIFLLYCKGAQPILHIYKQQSFYLTALLAMVVFALFEQMIFCRRMLKPDFNKKQRKTEMEVEPTDKKDWRNR